MAASTVQHSVEPSAEPAAHLGQANSENVMDHAEEDSPGKESSETSESSSDGEQVEDGIKQDMLKLEESFEEHGMKFRLIDRIGEGMPRNN